MYTLFVFTQRFGFFMPWQRDLYPEYEHWHCTSCFRSPFTIQKRMNFEVKILVPNVLTRVLLILHTILLDEYTITLLLDNREVHTWIAIKSLKHLKQIKYTLFRPGKVSLAILNFVSSNCSTRYSNAINIRPYGAAKKRGFTF